MSGLLQVHGPTAALATRHKFIGKSLYVEMSPDTYSLSAIFF
jgi:hypothetical protein